MKRFLPILLLCCVAATPTPVWSPVPSDPLCIALKSTLGRAIIEQKRVSDDITKLVATLSKYSESQTNGETGTAYNTGFTALQGVGRLNDDLALLERQVKQLTPLTDGDGATIERDLQIVATAQAEVAKDSSGLLNEWNQHVQLDANSASTAGMGSHGANPFGGFGGNGGGASSAIAVMEVRPLLISTLRTMDRASAALQDMHPAVARSVLTCFSRARRQSHGK